MRSRRSAARRVTGAVEAAHPRRGVAQGGLDLTGSLGHPGVGAGDGHRADQHAARTAHRGGDAGRTRPGTRRTPTPSPRSATTSSCSASSRWLVIVPGPKRGIGSSSRCRCRCSGPCSRAGSCPARWRAAPRGSRTRSGAGTGQSGESTVKTTTICEPRCTAKYAARESCSCSAGHLGPDLARHPDLLVQRDPELVQLVAELEALLLPDVHQVVAVEQLAGQAVDRGQRQAGHVRDLLGRGPAARGHHLEDVQGAVHRARRRCARVRARLHARCRSGRRLTTAQLWKVRNPRNPSRPEMALS